MTGKSRRARLIPASLPPKERQRGKQQLGYATESEVIVMCDRLYQVTYRAPVSYEGSESDATNLRAVVQKFIGEHAAQGYGVVCIKVGFVLGMFLVFTDTAAHAALLPWEYNGFERFRDSTEIETEKVNASGPLFYQASTAEF